MSLRDWITGLFARHGDPAELSPSRALPALPGAPVELPAGAPPLPPGQLDVATRMLGDSIADGSRHGLPLVNHPQRALAAEEGVARLHRADQYQLGGWLTDYAAVEDGLRQTAAELVTDANQKRDEANLVKVDLQAQAQSLRDQLPSRVHQFAAKASPYAPYLVAVVVLLVLVETGVFAPILDATLEVPRWVAIGTAFFWAVLATAAAYLAGHQTQEALHYEGPPRNRTGHMALAVASGVMAAGSVAGGALLRFQSLDPNYAGLESIAALVFLQATPLVLASGHGFMSNDPGVAELRGVELELGRVEVDEATFADAAAEAEEHLSALELFDPKAKVRTQSRVTQERYEALVRNSRDIRWNALIDAGHDRSAQKLLTLPLPDLAIPDIFPANSDDADWYVGPVVLHL